MDSSDKSLITSIEDALEDLAISPEVTRWRSKSADSLLALANEIIFEIPFPLDERKQINLPCKTWVDVDIILSNLLCYPLPQLGNGHLEKVHFLLTELQTRKIINTPEKVKTPKVEEKDVETPKVEEKDPTDNVRVKLVQSLLASGHSLTDDKLKDILSSFSHLELSAEQLDMICQCHAHLQSDMKHRQNMMFQRYRLLQKSYEISDKNNDDLLEVKAPTKMKEDLAHYFFLPSTTRQQAGRVMREGKTVISDRGGRVHEEERGRMPDWKLTGSKYNRSGNQHGGHGKGNNDRRKPPQSKQNSKNSNSNAKPTSTSPKPSSKNKSTVGDKKDLAPNVKGTEKSTPKDSMSSSTAPKHQTQEKGKEKHRSKKNPTQDAKDVDKTTQKASASSVAQDNAGKSVQDDSESSSKAKADGQGKNGSSTDTNTTGETNEGASRKGVNDKGTDGGEPTKKKKSNPRKRSNKPKPKT
mmetsp:Transcript_5797/g.8894  ORF Transcript_5797/g.8894 Transcript_5797/m.8894 type:complete len:469 (+) Transcript_5797:215-1621(+)